jgi:hypothetical protein
MAPAGLTMAPFGLAVSDKARCGAPAPAFSNCSAIAVKLKPHRIGRQGHRPDPRSSVSTVSRVGRLLWARCRDRSSSRSSA